MTNNNTNTSNTSNTSNNTHLVFNGVYVWGGEYACPICGETYCGEDFALVQSPNGAYYACPDCEGL